MALVQLLREQQTDLSVRAKTLTPPRLAEFKEEQSFVPDYSGNESEWNEIVNANGPPAYSDASVDMADAVAYDFESSDGSVPGWLKPCERQRHIGIDQGEKNFAMVAVDTVPNAVPVVVGAELYDLQREGLNRRVRGKKVLTLILNTNEIFAAIVCYKQDEHYGIGRSIATAAIAEKNHCKVV